MILVVALAIVVGAVFSGYAAVRARAQGGTSRQALAPVAVPTPSGTHTPSTSTSPQFQSWTVGVARRPLTVLRRPSTGAPVVTRLGTRTSAGYPTLVLVDAVRQVGGVPWYKVWLAVPPNETRGWVRDGSLAFYKTTSKIVVDLSRRKLMVYRRGALEGTFPVAVGQPGLATPTGFFFINQKLKPPAPGGAYGALAMGLSAYQPKLPNWPGGGEVAIHGTNEDYLIGKAVSHGCIRMHDKDILTVARLVPAGSPVIIQN